MNKFLKIVLIILIICTGFNACAQAYELQRNAIETFVINEVKRQTSAQLKEYAPYEIDVKIMNLPVEKIVTLSDKMPVIEVVSSSDKFMQYDIKRVVVSDNNQIVRITPVNVRISIYKNVLVAKEYINQFEVINGANTYYKRMEVGMNIKNVIPENGLIQPLVATRSVTKDNLILSCYTRPKPDIVRNSDVKIIFKQGDEFNIEIEGIAMKEGRIGDLIVVKNTKYNKLHTATIIGENKVEVKL